MIRSLEIKKFVNNEHIGEYADVMLPAVPARGRATEDETAANRVFAKLHYLEKGTGEPLVLVHTVGQSLYTWRRVFDRLSEHYRVIAVDLLGHGYSERPQDFSFAVEDHAEVLLSLLDVLKIKSAHFVGFSLSCAYVLRLAQTNPERVGKLVLLSPGGVTSEMPSIVHSIDNPILGFFASKTYGMRAINNVLNNAVFDLTNITQDVVTEYFRPAADSLGRRAIRLSLQRFDDTDIIANLRNMNTPTLILTSSEDKWHPASASEIYHTALTTAVTSIVRNAGHLMHEEKPDRIVSALLEYIPVPMP